VSQARVRKPFPACRAASEVRRFFLHPSRNRNYVIPNGVCEVRNPSASWVSPHPPFLTTRSTYSAIAAMS
jgi:hypothetical protein